MKYEMLAPTIPNFVQVIIGGSKVAISISELNDDDIDWLAARWKEELLKARSFKRSLADD